MPGCFVNLFQMKLFALLVMYKDESPTRLKAAFDVSSFSFFQRSSVQGNLQLFRELYYLNCR